MIGLSPIFQALKGHVSDPLSVTCGVSRGFILGPLLFLLYIGDLPNILKRLTSHLFADDTNI